MRDVFKFIGDMGEAKVVKEGESRYVITCGTRRVTTNDGEYAMDVARHFAQHGENGVVA